MWQTWIDKIYSLKNLFLPPLNPDDVSLVRETGLFSKARDIMTSAQVVSYPQGHPIPSSGALYIIKEGRVKISHSDIPQAFLSKGDFFGEEILLGRKFKSRAGTIETLTPTTLIKFYPDSFAPSIEKGKTYAEMYQRSIVPGDYASDFHKMLEDLIASVPDHQILHFSSGELIFKVGDPSTYVYIILEGEVELLIVDKDDSTFSSQVLHQGHLFGEVNVLKQRPRSVTAKAKSRVEAIAIKSEDFRKYYKGNRQLQQMLTKLHNLYRIPLKGFVNLYIGYIEDLGVTFTNIYLLEDGRHVVASSFLDQKIFTMAISNAPKGHTYLYEKGGNQLILNVADGHITKIRVNGVWTGIAKFCRFLLNNDKISDLSSDFKEAVSRPAPKNVDIICPCMDLSRYQLTEMINKGLDTFEALTKASGVSLICGECFSEVSDMLGLRYWFPATLAKGEIHDAMTHSYWIKPQFVCGTFHVGQTVNIQFDVKGVAVERRYLISGLRPNGELRITLQKGGGEWRDPAIEWLFHDALERQEIQMMQPKGGFPLTSDAQAKIVCIAEGLGISPFIALAQDLSFSHSKRRVHMIYVASDFNAFLFQSEIKNLVQAMPTLSIAYRALDTEGVLSPGEIDKIVKYLATPEVYICGSEAFTNSIVEHLHGAGLRYPHAIVYCQSAELTRPRKRA